MEISLIVMIVGIILIIISFFMKDSSKKLEKEIEELSFTFYQETSTLKRRIKVVEEELMIEPSSKIAPKPNAKPVIHEIIKSQVQELYKQGYSLAEISARSSLSIEQVNSVIGGVER